MTSQIKRASSRRGAAEKRPQLSDIHFPVGGPRLRPTLEDLLEMLIHDLGIDHSDSALDALADARAGWRRDQARAIVGADQETAAQVLREAGWGGAPMWCVKRRRVVSWLVVGRRVCRCGSWRAGSGCGGGPGRGRPGYGVCLGFVCAGSRPG